MKTTDALKKLEEQSLAIRDACIDLNAVRLCITSEDPMSADQLAAVETKLRTLLLGETTEKLFGLEIVNQDAWNWYNSKNMFCDSLSDMDPQVYRALLDMDEHSLAVRGLARVKAEEATAAPAPRKPRARK